MNNISIWSATGGKIIIDPGLSTQEIIAITGVSGSSLVVPASGRGQEGTTAQGHNAGAVVWSVPFAGDWNSMITALENVCLATTGALDTTKVTDLTTVQTLTNKTLTAPTITGPTITGTIAGNPTITAPTITGPSITGTIGGNPTITKPVVNGRTDARTLDTDGATITFDMTASNYHEVVLGGNRTLAVSNVSWSSTTTQPFILRLKQDATGSRTVTWFATISWAGGTVPTLTTSVNKADSFGFIPTSATTYDGFIIGQNI